MAEPYLSVLTRLINDLGLPLADEIAIDCRHFFSGAALYANGAICASLSPVGFGIKLPVDIRDELFKTGEGTELRYFKSAPVKKDYVVLSQSIVDDEERLKTLLIHSIDHVATQ
jgi:TfoX/Sxy family transcriptional regulator of competence genes